MVDQRLHALGTSDAIRLAELYLHQQDIARSIKAIELWSLEFSGLAKEDAVAIKSSLFRDAVLQFVGCFDPTDKQHRLDATVIYRDYGKADEYFRWLKDVRDSYGAHRFGPLRQAVVGGARLPNGKHALGVSCSVYDGPELAERPRFRAFMKIAEKWLAAEFATLNAKVLDSVVNMSAEELSALPWAKTTKAVGPDDIRKSRAAFAKSQTADVSTDDVEGTVYLTVSVEE